MASGSSRSRWRGVTSVALTIEAIVLLSGACGTRAGSVGSVVQPSSGVDALGGAGPLSAALAGYWRFDDGAGGAAADSSGNGNDGQLFNFTGASWVAGRVRGGLDYAAGGRPHVAVPGTSALNPTDAVSVAAWVFPRTWCVGAFNSTRVVQKGQIVGDEPNQYALMCENFTELVFEAGANKLRGPLPGTGAWHHVAATYDGAMLRLYTDGIEVAAQAGSGAIPGPIAAPVDWLHGALFIGAKNTSGSFFDGVIDEVAIWGRALAAAEIARLHSGATPTDR